VKALFISDKTRILQYLGSHVEWSPNGLIKIRWEGVNGSSEAEIPNLDIQALWIEAEGFVEVF